MAFQDLVFTKAGGVATITINRPEVLNAFRSLTADELVAALQDAGRDPAIGVIVLTGAGDRAFCVGGDFKERTPGGYRGASWVDIGAQTEAVHHAVRQAPKPVIAAVNGYAIGGGNVLQALCDLSIAADHATFGQVGPRVGSFDAGFGTAYLARLVGERKAREIWYLCRKYSAAEALAMGLVNAVVPMAELRATVAAWCQEILAHSPTAMKLVKQSFNADTEHIAGISHLAFSALNLYYQTPESDEGHTALVEKRPTNFARFRRHWQPPEAAE